jgi:hypothetical protein
MAWMHSQDPSSSSPVTGRAYIFLWSTKPLTVGGEGPHQCCCIRWQHVQLHMQALVLVVMGMPEM